MNAIDQNNYLIHTNKQMASMLGRSENYVQDMKSGGFKMPASLTEAVEWIRVHGPPGKFRQHPTKNGLYSHANKGKDKP